MDEEVALKIYRLGMKEFSDCGDYICSFADFLLGMRQVDLAIQLLEESVEKVKEEDKKRLWDKLVLVNARYKLTSPIASILSLQQRYNQAIPSDTNSPVIQDIARYVLWGVSLLIGS